MPSILQLWAIPRGPLASLIVQRQNRRMEMLSALGAASTNQKQDLTTVVSPSSRSWKYFLRHPAPLSEENSLWVSENWDTALSWVSPLLSHVNRAFPFVFASSSGPPAVHLCFSFFPHCCDKTPRHKQLQGKRVNSGSQFQGAVNHSGEVKAAGAGSSCHTAPATRTQRASTKRLCSVHFLLCLQSRTPHS